MSANKTDNPFSFIRPSKIILPVIIGLGVVFYLFIREYKPGSFSSLHFTYKAVFFLLLAFLFMACRDIGYMIRIRILTDYELTWRKAFRVIMLWEFTSAITPSAVGGTSVAILFVTKEGVSIGKSSAAVMTTSFLDELYFIAVFPLLLLFINAKALFIIGGVSAQSTSYMNEFFYFALIGYFLKFVYIIILSYGLFINPRGLKWILLNIFKWPFLKKWRQGANKAGTEIIQSSMEMKSKPISFWIKTFSATFLSWSSRYLVVNALFMAFFIVSDHTLLFARQFVMQNMLLVSPTPGGSGFAEFIFSRYLRDFLPNGLIHIESLVVALAFFWRLISYYPYLIMGSIIIPSWIKRKFHKTNIKS